MARDVPGLGAGVLEAPGSVDEYTFTGAAGQRVYFDALTGDPCAPTLRWKCVGPTGQVLFDRGFAATSGCGTGDPGSLVLEAAGRHTVTVYGVANATGSYSFNLVPVIPQTFTLVPGQTVAPGVPGDGAGAIEAPGALDVFSFQSGAGQRFYFDALTGDPCSPLLRWKCVGPTGEVLFDQAFAAWSGCATGDPGSLLLQSAGTYQVTVYGLADATGAYSFKLVPISNQSFPLLPGQRVTRDVPGAGAGAIESPGAIDQYTFTATAGQSVYFDALTGEPCSTTLRWKCVGPTNEVLFDKGFAGTSGCGGGDPGTFVLGTSGIYTVTVSGVTDNIGTYDFVIVPGKSDVFEIEVGQVVTNGVPRAGAGAIEVPGALDTYTFRATAGETVFFNALTGDPCAPTLRWRCLGPTNEVVFDLPFAGTSGCGRGDPGTLVLRAAGSYTVTVSGVTDATGDYAFQLVSVIPESFPLTRGQTVGPGVPGPGAGVIERPGGFDTYLFEATAGQKVYFDALTGVPCTTELRWKCVSPGGQVVFDQWFAARSGCGNGDPGNQVLSEAGKYSIVVYGDDEATGEYQFRLLPPAPEIVRQPSDQYVVAGRTVEFSVVAESETPVRYQWRLNGLALPGQTNSTLTLGPLADAQTGSCRVQVENDTGSVVSRTATFTVAALVGVSEAARTNLPPVNGDGIAVDLFLGSGGATVPAPESLAGRVPDAAMVSPRVDFPAPGSTVPVDAGLELFFAETATPPEALRGVASRNVLLRNSGFLRITRDLDREPATPEIDLELGVGSDAGFRLAIGGRMLGSVGEREFAYTWIPVAFAGEGLYPMSLIYAADASGRSGLELAWRTGGSAEGVIIPRDALYLSSDVGDRLVTFEELPAGTVLTNQFSNRGVLFAALAGNPRITDAGTGAGGLVPVSPRQVFADPDARNGILTEWELRFVVPGTGQPAVTEFVGFHLLNVSSPGATVVAFDGAGAVLVEKEYSGTVGSQEWVPIGAPGIARVRISLRSAERVSGIDQLSFTTPARGPDLVGGLLSVPTLAAPGSLVPFVWAVTNRGVESASAPWTERLVVLPGSPGEGALILGTYRAENALPPGGSLVRTQWVSFPYDGPAGDLRVELRLDVDRELQELDELNNTSAGPGLVTVPRTLTVLLSSRETVEGSPPLRATLIRNGDVSFYGFVTMSSSAPAALWTDAAVMFEPWSHSAEIALFTWRDGLVTGPRSAWITFRAEKFVDAAVMVTVLDADVPQLHLEVANPGVEEGGTVRAEVRREVAGPDPLTVFFSASPSGLLDLPSAVTIPAGAVSTSVAWAVVDDEVISASRRASVTAYALGHLDAPPVVLTLADNDRPALLLTFSKRDVGEGDGAQATMATVTRTPGGSFELPIEVESSDPTLLRVPSGMAFAPGQDSVRFPVSVVDDAVTQAARVVTLTVYPLDPATRQRISTGSTATVTVRDDDGLTLRVVVNRRLVTEGLDRATTATVHRTGPTDVPLRVSVVSSDPGEATVPATVTIPAGQGSVAFEIATLNDGIRDANQVVTVSADAPGYGSGSDVLVVSDLTQPDLVVREVVVPAEAVTEGAVNVSYRIANQGVSAASPGVLTRVFLSGEAVGDKDLAVGEFRFAGSLPPGQEIQQTLQIRLPVVAGDYTLKVVTDVEEQVDEALEDNNTTLALVPIRVREAYTASVTPDTTRSAAGVPVILRGRALKSGSTEPVEGVGVHVHVVTRETRRVLLAVTDADGRFVVTFQPLPGEAGRYEVAAAHPGAARPAAQAQFVIVGFVARPPASPVPLIEGVQKTVEVPFENLSDVPLTGLKVQVVQSPPLIRAEASMVGDAALPGDGRAVMRLVLNPDGIVASGAEVRMRATSAEGAILEFAVPVQVASARPALVAVPAELVAGMKRGAQTLVEFSIANVGGSRSEPLTVLAPDIPWLHVATAMPLDRLERGATNRVTLQLTPAADLALGEYEGALVIRSGDLSVPVPFRFLALSEAKGGLRITATDEYTYYAEGSPRVAGAAVVVRDGVSGAVVAEGITDALGVFNLPDVFEGYYDLEVSADRHVAYRGVSRVRAGATENVQAFLSRETVRYSWTVEPTGIEDRTRISIESVFETFVPIPVVTLEPNLIDLAEIKADVTQIDLRISNHGLIAANNLRLGFSGHPDWQLEPLVSDLGSLPARSSLVIPMTIRRLKPPALALHRPGATLHAGGACGITGGLVWTLVCGTEKSYSTPLQVLNAGGDCVGGEGSWGGTGSAAAPFFSMPFFPVRIDCNTNVPPCKPLDLPEVDLSALLKPLATAFDGLANFYLERNLWTRTLGLSVETEPEVKGKVGLCCTNEVPVEEITADLGGTVKLKMGDSYKTKINESLPSFRLTTNLTGVLELSGDLTFGVSGEPSFKVSGHYQDGCGREKPDISVTITGGVQFQGGVFGKAKASFKAVDVPIKLDEASVNGGMKGGLEFSWTYNNRGESKFCYKSEGLYLLANANLFGLSVDLFYPTNKHYLVPPATICDPPAALLASLGLEQVIAEARRHVDDAAREHSRHLALQGPPPGDAGDGVCAQVRLKLDQDLILTRSAFNATLEIDNQDPALPIEDLSLRIGVLSPNGRGADERFEIRTQRLESISAIDGTGVLAPETKGTASWVLIPSSEAAPDGPANYRVGGVLRYRQGGRVLTVPLAEVPITVQPDPRLRVRYFHQRDVYSDDPFTAEVEPSLPYSLAVMIQNSGKGVARDVRITSAEPKIVENEKGLLIDFKILGTELDGRSATPSLTAEFGQIDPGRIAIGRWLLTSSLQGLFVDYQASVEHQPDERDRKSSIVEEVSIHEMIRPVQVQGSQEDRGPDFLVNDVPDPEDLPDRVYLSDGSIERVTVKREAIFDGVLDAEHLTVNMTTAASDDWTYLRVPDPGNGRFRLLKVTRENGEEIAVGTNVWTTDRTFVGNGRKPRREALLHLLASGVRGSLRYTLVYGALPPSDALPPASHVDPLPAESFALIPVSWSGSDNPGGSGIAAYDVFVSVDGGPFAPWLQQTPNAGGIYNGQLGSRYGFYSVAIDRLGNRQADPGIADVETRVTRVNHPPSLAEIPDQSVEQGDVMIVRPNASDPDGDPLSWEFVGSAPPGALIHPETGVITWATGEGLSPGTVRLTVQVLDRGVPRLGTTRAFNVTIGDRNAAPVLPMIGDRTINEGRVLEFSAAATDADLPPQRLTYRFAGPVPSGATLDPVTGDFSWRPNAAQGGATYPIVISVSDNGTPPLSATQAFRVVVRDTRSDFALELGTTNLLSGTRNAIPLALRASSGLRSLSFLVETPGGRVSDLALDPVAPELATVVLAPAGIDTVTVQLAAAAGQTLPASAELGRLRFTADSEPGSAVVPFRLLDVLASGSGGESLTNATVTGGRAFLVESEPLLDATLSVTGRRELVLYGLAGRSYEVQASASLSGVPNWVTFTEVSLGEAPFVRVPAESASGDAGARPVFYRAVEREGAPRLRLLTGDGGRLRLQIDGKAGMVCRVQSRAELGVGVWADEARITLNNGTHILDLPTDGARHRYFRAVAE